MRNNAGVLVGVQLENIKWQDAFGNGEHDRY